ncbi:Ni/Fe-hydrogenase cytochrome b subunit [Parasulfuritortus cantonensis]|uniref:Ni/Fe-hydrogenase cytochrome b subunit n=1 Tax=Parasulfuritortus cantonensis TaxID=2528202 RepID=A0A4R1BGR9_9PROT|nr:Ni/Fe-hydrogenase cytochrome b subunit [Parasulfuritortus cantonensis]TCJ16278.1 Ni/Fe-hydrogenase cytochrome b subunit [Parasulfuritortus cantonensis]
MSNHAHSAPAPLGGSLVTSLTKTMALLILIAGAVLVVRLVLGIGSVTNVNDGYTWGIWVVYDVMVGSAFACGGYSVALLVYIFNKGEYHPLVRPALLGSLFGYTLAGVSVIIDLGRYWNTWHIFTPGWAQINSVMFEVATCISLYVVVMWIEFSPVFMEKFNKDELRKKLGRWMFLFIALGALLPSMHQSSLGSMLIVLGTQLNPLWQSLLIPVFYLLTAISVGYAIVIFESTVSAIGFKRPFELGILAKLSKVMWGVILVYLVVRVADLVVRGAVGEAFKPNIMALMFWIEMAFFVVPAVLLAKASNRRRPDKLFLSAACMMTGTFLLRINSYLVGYETGDGWNYFPSLAEMGLTIGIIAIEILGYVVLVRLLPVLPKHEAAVK